MTIDNSPKDDEVFNDNDNYVNPNQEKIDLFRILFQHKFDTVKQLFIDLLKIEIPKDILRESDKDYIKANISKILVYYIIKLWSGHFINLSDKFFICYQCNQRSYLRVYDLTLSRKIIKDLCIFCHIKMKGGIR